MIAEAKDIMEKAAKVEEKTSLLRKIPWWVYVLVIAGGWYVLKGPSEQKESNEE